MNVNLTNAISLHPLPLVHQVQSSANDEQRPSSSSSRRGTPSHPHRPSHNLRSLNVDHTSPAGPAAKHATKDGASTSYEADEAVKTIPDVTTRRPSSVMASLDLEHQPPYSSADDPYNLWSKRKTDTEIASIESTIKRRGGKSTKGPLQSGKAAWHAYKVGKFYKTQNDNIERLLKPVEGHRAEARLGNESSAFKFKFAVNASFVANVCLAILQVYGAIASGSLSLFTTMADALFDPMSNITLMLSARATKRVDPRRFPSGKARIETTGNIVFCFLMTSVSFILIAMSARELAEGNENETNGFHVPSVVAVGVAFVTKFALFCYCWALRNKYSQIRILWEDHRNDLIINGFGLLTSVGGSKLRWWIDPMGAIILSCLIAGLWLKTAYSEFQLLIGVTADTEMLQLITYISMTHSDSITALDTVRAYHSGPRLIVEVDVVMSPDDTLRATHDVAEELQMKLEDLPDVERAYVHVDFETSHAPEHFLKKEI